MHGNGSEHSFVVCRCRLLTIFRAVITAHMRGFCFVFLFLLHKKSQPMTTHTRALSVLSLRCREMCLVQLFTNLMRNRI